MAIRILLKEHLENLKRIESAKPPNQHRPVPSLTKLAKAVDSYQSTLSRMHTNRKLDLILVDKILIYLNQQGFETKLSDILDWQLN
jgi:hypothetical protein